MRIKKLIGNYDENGVHNAMNAAWGITTDDDVKDSFGRSCSFLMKIKELLKNQLSCLMNALKSIWI